MSPKARSRNPDGRRKEIAASKNARTAVARTPAIPTRTCIGCMTRDRKDAMVRIAGSENHLAPDFGARAPGRGGYLHPRTECMDRFLKSKAREFRSLRMKLGREQRTSIVEAIRERLDRERPLE